MEFVDFIVENYIWFLVGGIVLLMTVIGYFAEKTEFGKKQPEKKKKVKSIQEKEVTPVIAEEEPMADLDPISLETVVEPEILKEQPYMQEEIREDDYINSEILNEEPVDVKEEISEDLYAGLDGTPNSYKDEEPKEEFKTDLDLPNIESLKDDTDEEDMWKF